MVWLVEKKIFRHILDVDFERVEIPVRVKFEFEVLDGSFVPDTLTKEMIYNKDAILKHYPGLKSSSLDSAIAGMVDDEIMDCIRRCGLLPDKPHDAI